MNTNLFDKQPPKIGEIFETLYKQKDIEIMHIVSSSNLNSNTYNQAEDEFVLLLEGAAVLEVEDTEVFLKKGEYILLKAHTKHRILNCEDGTHWFVVYIKIVNRRKNRLGRF